MSNPWSPASFNVEDLSSNYRGDLDPEKIVWLQIQRCNVLHSTGDEMLYGNAVMSLLINVPEDIRLEVEDNENEYHHVAKIWKPAGRFSADPENPFTINNPGDLDYDPKFKGRHYEPDGDGFKEVYVIGGIHQISPLWLEDESWDYYALQKMIMAALQGHGLTWKKERTEIFTGEEWDPAFDPPEEEATDERDEPKKN